MHNLLVGRGGGGELIEYDETSLGMASQSRKELNTAHILFVNERQSPNESCSEHTTFFLSWPPGIAIHPSNRVETHNEAMYTVVADSLRLFPLMNAISNDQIYPPPFSQSGCRATKERPDQTWAALA